MFQGSQEQGVLGLTPPCAPSPGGLCLQPTVLLPLVLLSTASLASCAVETMPVSCRASQGPEGCETPAGTRPVSPHPVRVP